MCNKIIFWANRRCADRRSWVYVCQKQVRAESSSNQSVRVGGEAKVFTGPAGMSTEAKTATGDRSQKTELSSRGKKASIYALDELAKSA